MATLIATVVLKPGFNPTDYEFSFSNPLGTLLAGYMQPSNIFIHNNGINRRYFVRHKASGKFFHKEGVFNAFGGGELPADVPVGGGSGGSTGSPTGGSGGGGSTGSPTGGSGGSTGGVVACAIQLGAVGLRIISTTCQIILAEMGVGRITGTDKDPEYPIEKISFSLY